MFNEILGQKSDETQLDGELGLGGNIAPNNLTFHDNGKEIGKLSWDSNKISFKGKVDESAKIFFKYFLDLFNHP